MFCKKKKRIWDTFNGKVPMTCMRLYVEQYRLIQILEHFLGQVSDKNYKRPRKPRESLYNTVIGVPRLNSLNRDNYQFWVSLPYNFFENNFRECHLRTFILLPI